MTEWIHLDEYAAIRQTQSLLHDACHNYGWALIESHYAGSQMEKDLRSARLLC